MNPAPRTLEELVARLESGPTWDSVDQNSIDNPLGTWDFRGNENQILPINDFTSLTSSEELPARLSSPNDFIEHSFALNKLISFMVNTRLSFHVEAFLACLQAVHGPQLTVGQAILTLRNHPSNNPYNLHNLHSGHSASPSMSLMPPMEATPASPGFIVPEPGTSVGVRMEVPDEVETRDMSAFRRVFSDGDRVKAECLWPNCGKMMMRDNHPRHMRECHLRVRRGVMRRNNTFHTSSSVG